MEDLAGPSRLLGHVEHRLARILGASDRERERDWNLTCVPMALDVLTGRTIAGSLLAWVQRSKVQRLKELNTFLLIFFTYLSSAMFLQNHHSQKKHDIAL